MASELSQEKSEIVIIPIVYDEDVKLPLAVYQTMTIGEMREIGGETFSIIMGMDKGTASQLKNLSLDQTDEELQNNTSDRKRFGERSYENWYRKNRTPFVLVNQKGALAAIMWFGPEKNRNLHKKGWHTIAWRSYRPFRGRKLMGKFAKFAMDAYNKSNPNVKLYAVIKKTNTGSAALAEKLGFVLKAEDEKEKIMIKE